MAEITETTNNFLDSKPNMNKKKKKRNKFLANAKGFGKQGIYGRGTQLNDDEYSYFINILEAIKGGFESLSDKVTMANNVFEQTVDKEIHLSSNQIVCKAIEHLIGFTEPANFERFLKSFAGNFRPICSDKFASHVVQKSIEIAFLRAVQTEYVQPTDKEDESEPCSKKIKPETLSEKEYNLKNAFSDEHRAQCGDFVLRIGKFLLNNLEDFLWDPYATHIMRMSVLCLAGIHVSKVAFESKKSGMPNDSITFKVSSEWLDVVKEFSQRLEMWPQFPEMPFQNISSAFLGSLCISLKQVDINILKHFGKKILISSFLKSESNDNKIEINDDGNCNNDIGEKSLAKVFTNISSLFLLETLLSIAGSKLLTQLYSMLFAERLPVLAKSNQTNFAVQRLIENIKEKIDFESIFNELADHLEEILTNGNNGVVSALSAACLRLQTKQGNFVSSLQKMFHISNSKEKANYIFLCLIKMKPYQGTLEDKTLTVHLQGSIIIQNLLKFNKPIFLVNCILETSSTDLSSIFSTPNGSFIVDAFLESKFIGEKSREKLIKHLEGSYIYMAVTRHGSRVVERCFEAAADAQKGRIIKELSEKVNQLNGTQYGRLLFKKFRIETYCLSPSQWKAAFDRPKKVEKLFKDIIN